MTISKFLATGIAIAATCGVAQAQERLYAFHSGPQHGCPPLDWHVLLTNGNQLDGVVSWNNMQSMAHVSGTLNVDAKTFQMNATEQGGQNRTATISGTVEANGYLVASIDGPNVKCTGVRVQWFPAGPPSQ